MVIRRTKARSLAEILEEYLKESGLDIHLKERELIRQWEEVVGSMIARSTRSIYITDRKLIVTVRSAVIRNELFLVRDSLLHELNRRVGAQLIDEVIIR